MHICFSTLRYHLNYGPLILQISQDLFQLSHLHSSQVLNWCFLLINLICIICPTTIISDVLMFSTPSWAAWKSTPKMLASERLNPIPLSFLRATIGLLPSSPLSPFEFSTHVMSLIRILNASPQEHPKSIPTSARLSNSPSPRCCSSNTYDLPRNERKWLTSSLLP